MKQKILKKEDLLEILGNIRKSKPESRNDSKLKKFLERRDYDSCIERVKYSCALESLFDSPRLETIWRDVHDISKKANLSEEYKMRLSGASYNLSQALHRAKEIEDKHKIGNFKKIKSYKFFRNLLENKEEDLSLYLSEEFGEFHSGKKFFQNFFKNAIIKPTGFTYGVYIDDDSDLLKKREAFVYSDKYSSRDTILPIFVAGKKYADHFKNRLAPLNVLPDSLETNSEPKNKALSVLRHEYKHVIDHIVQRLDPHSFYLTEHSAEIFSNQNLKKYATEKDGQYLISMCEKREKQEISDLFLESMEREGGCIDKMMGEKMYADVKEKEKHLKNKYINLKNEIFHTIAQILVSEENIKQVLNPVTLSYFFTATPYKNIASEIKSLDALTMGMGVIYLNKDYSYLLENEQKKK